MSNRLPSLTALRTFEAAARNLSFARAAEELFVTPAAVGYQIKQLEEDLGTTLFLRRHRAVTLTDRGQQLLADLGPTFKTIQSAWDAARAPVPEKTLRVSGPARAAHAWVMPALARATDTPPGLRIAWDLSKQVRDVASGDVDLAIRWAREPSGDLHWEPLLRTWFTPLMRADIARHVQRPADLEKLGLIDVEFVLDAGAAGSTWAPWCHLNGLDPPTDFAVSCADTASAVETALATGYVAMAGSFLAADHLTRGALVAPFDTAIAPLSRFWLVCRKGMETTPEYQWFADTLRKGGASVDTHLTGRRLHHPDGRQVAP